MNNMLSWMFCKLGGIFCRLNGGLEGLSKDNFLNKWMTWAWGISYYYDEKDLAERMRKERENEY